MKWIKIITYAVVNLICLCLSIMAFANFMGSSYSDKPFRFLVVVFVSLAIFVIPNAFVALLFNVIKYDYETRKK